MDRAAPFSALVETHRREILGYLVRMLGNPHDAEDVCQEVFLRAQLAFGRLREASNARAWLYRIATRRAITAARVLRRRAQRADPIDPDELAAGEESRADAQAVRKLRRAVDELPPRQRAALMLRQFQGQSYAEIARSMGGNEASARANVYQAIRTLRLAFAGEKNERIP